MSRPLLATAALSLLFAVGCTAAAEEDAPERRGGIGKADLFGSCADTACDGAATDGNCWCDDLCETYGDCCDDYAAVCDGAPVQGCGGFAGLTCDEGEYCHYELDQTCGAADQLGACKSRPQACAALYAPVCGCDGNTYSNSCYAAASGVSVAAEGACATPSACDAAGGFCVSGDVCPADTVSDDASCDGDPSGGVTCCKPGFFPPPTPASTCVDACGGQSADGSCWCDDLCETYGDCCDDYADACS